MVKYKNLIFAILIILFLIFSFYPTIFELQRKDNLADKRREFILEHNYYWPDYNLYLSKIRQGLEGRLTAVEKYTNEPHQGSLIQEFYVVLGWLGKVFNLSPNYAYLLGRIILAPLLLFIIYKLSIIYFPSSIFQFLAFLIVIVSGSFPRIYQDAAGITHIGRFMEWWSNIDALQRITFIPHILFGQVVSFYLLFKLAIEQSNNRTMKRLLIYILLGNLAGLTFPPSLITLDGVLILLIILRLIRYQISKIKDQKYILNIKNIFNFLYAYFIFDILFLIFSLPSLLYIFLITKYTPWSALITFHRTHPMMIPFDQYILGTGPIFFLGLAGAIISIVKRDRKFQPLIFWILATFGFAALFSVVRDQSPLRFTQTGLFIPLGILGTYLFYQVRLFIQEFCGEDMLFEHAHGLERLESAGGRRVGRAWEVRKKAYRPQQNSRQDPQIIIAAFIIFISLYLIGSLYMMKTSLDWQTDWISQRIGADVPPVPYPPQTMYPLAEWMDGIRWLKNNTSPNDVVLAEITAANHIPAYSGNFVYWGQSNTVDYNRKELEVDKFFGGKMSENEARIFLKNGRIKYIFFSLQEKEKVGGKNLESLYPFLKSVYSNNLVNLYSISY